MDTLGIAEYYSGRNIFITGGTGFMGKVLIEKLLRSCPDLEGIYLLMRPKKGKAPEERVAELTDLPLFDRLKRERPNALTEKVHLVLGDVTKLGLGLSAEDRKQLVEKVSIIFHSAASVRFDDPLKDAILMNTRGTREVVNLAMEMKNLSVLLHVSTTYCNTDRDVIEEVIHPPHADWREAIKVAEKCDEHILNILTPKYMDKLPNSYCFTKSLAEHVINDMCKDKIPAVVFRPSIVISTIDDPIPGWIDNFNGPVGILVASGKGIMRSVYSDPNVKADYMPVDVAIKAMIIATWQKGIKKDLDVSVYNCSPHGIKRITLKELVEVGYRLTSEIPLNNVLWYPGGGVTSSKIYHYLRVIFLHLLPALIVDGLLKLFKRKPMLVKLQRRIYIANMALDYFITREWLFKNEKTINLTYLVPENERDKFSFESVFDVEVYDYFKNAMYGGRQYLLKEDISTLPQAKKHSQIMFYIDKATSIIALVIFVWILFKLNIYNIILRRVQSIFTLD